MSSKQSSHNTHGGARPGAGRKPKAAQATVVKRVPVSLVPKLEEMITVMAAAVHIKASHTVPDGAFIPAENRTKLQIPLASSSVPAGFASPAEPYLHDYLDFNEYLILHPAATIALRCGGDSMLDAGIHKGDLLIIDRSLSARHGHIVLADLGGKFTIKRLYNKNGVVELHSENSSGGNYPNYTFKEGEELLIVGVVIHVIKDVA